MTQKNRSGSAVLIRSFQSSIWLFQSLNLFDPARIDLFEFLRSSPTLSIKRLEEDRKDGDKIKHNTKSKKIEADPLRSLTLSSGESWRHTGQKNGKAVRRIYLFCLLETSEEESGSFIHEYNSLAYNFQITLQ